MFFYRKENIWWKNEIKKIKHKLQELMIRAYQVMVNDINDEIWATNKNN